MSHSQKISQFNTQSVLANTDLFALVRNGQNFKVPFSTIKADLGVTGTLSQTGSPLGAPVLEEVAPNTYNVRNMESGNGVLASLSPQNGLMLDWNVTQDATGVPITADLTKSIPKISSLVPGAGMQITKVGDAITFTATGTPLPATKAISVNVIGDFPTAIGGVITLEPDTVYIISNDISTPNRFIRQNNTSVVSYSQLGPSLEYTGTGTMFTSVDANTLVFGLRLNCPNGKVFDWTDTTGNTRIETIKETRIDSCVELGSFTGGRAFLLGASGTPNVMDTGIKFFGTGWDLISIDRFTTVTTNVAFVGVDLGSAVANSIGLSNIRLFGPSGAIGVTGLSNSGNITSGNLATITGSGFIGGITPITGINPVSDARWESLGNDGIGDSRDDALISMQGNAVETVIGTISVPVKLEGTWVSESNSRFDVTLDGGRMTYTGERSAKLPIDASLSCLLASGGDKQIAAFVAINGVAINNAMIITTSSAAKAGTIKLLWQHDFQPGDYIEMFISNESDTTNIVVQSAIARID